MTTFVLVHGSWHGAWCWRPVARKLVALGHQVLAPTLSGCAERFHHAADQVTLGTHVKDVSDLLFYEDVRDAVLVAHSYAGLVAQGVVNVAPQRLSGVVFLDAYVVEAGQKGYDLWTEERRAQARDSIAQGYPYRAPFEPSFLGITDPDAAEYVRERLTPHPLATYDESVPAENAAAAALPRLYVACTEGPLAAIFAPIVGEVEKRGWPVQAMSAPHDVMLTHPDELTELLSRAATRFSRHGEPLHFAGPADPSPSE